MMHAPEKQACLLEKLKREFGGYLLAALDDPEAIEIILNIAKKVCSIQDSKCQRYRHFQKSTNLKSTF